MCADVSHTGHRKRLLERFRKSGIQGLHDYEVLELLLTFALPRRDTKPVAKRLIARYKTLNTVLSTPADKLETVDGISARAATLFPLLKEIMASCLREKYEERSVITHRRDVEEYLRFHFGLRRCEYVAALFLDNGHHVLSTELLSEGTANQCAVYPRRVVDRALRRDASSIIIAHNHPGGVPEASEADWRLTKRLCQVGKLLDLPLLDHVIISRDKVISLREHPRWPR